MCVLFLFTGSQGLEDFCSLSSRHSEPSEVEQHPGQFRAHSPQVRGLPMPGASYIYPRYPHMPRELEMFEKSFPE